MGLVRDGRLVPDPFTDASTLEAIPAGQPVIVSLAQWQAHGAALRASGQPLGLRLRSDQHPGDVAGDLAAFQVIALEFPRFRDGRAYTYARLLRERYGYRGELRAVGDVLQEQLNFMRRCGFDSFEINAADPERAWATVANDHTVWYQATGDGHPRALDLRHRR
jgi:uncharacterized protein (DUF934 family)